MLKIFSVINVNLNAKFNVQLLKSHAKTKKNFFHNFFSLHKF